MTSVAAVCGSCNCLCPCVCGCPSCGCWPDDEPASGTCRIVWCRSRPAKPGSDYCIVHSERMT